MKLAADLRRPSIVIGAPVVFSFDRVKPGALATCAYDVPRPQRFGDRSCGVFFHGRAAAFELTEIIAGDTRHLLQAIPLTLLPDVFHGNLSFAVSGGMIVRLTVRNVDARRTLSLVIALEPLEIGR
jgi:hypothetical protein